MCMCRYTHIAEHIVCDSLNTCHSKNTCKTRPTRSVCSVLICEAQSASYLVNCACVHLCACLCIAAFCNPVVNPILSFVHLYVNCSASSVPPSRSVAGPAVQIHARKGPIVQVQARKKGLQAPLFRFRPGKGCRPSCSGSGPGLVLQVQARKGLQAQMFRFRPGQGLQAQLFRFRLGKGLQAQLFSFRSGKGCRPSCSGSGPERVAGRKGLQALCCRLRPGTGCRPRFAGSGPERVAGPVVQVQARKGLQAQFCRFRPGKGRRPSKTRPATQTLLISNKRIFSFFKIVEAFGLQGSFLRPGKRLQAPLCRFRP